MYEGVTHWGWGKSGGGCWGGIHKVGEEAGIHGLEREDTESENEKTEWNEAQ